MIYYSNTAILFSGAILRALGNATTDEWGPFSVGVTVYGGMVPSAAAVESSWQSYNSSNSIFIVHYDSMLWGQPDFSNSLKLVEQPDPAPTPINSGTATWAIIWAGQPTGSQLSSTVLPFSDFLTVTVGDAASDGVIRFDSNVMTPGNPARITDANITVNI